MAEIGDGLYVRLGLWLGVWLACFSSPPWSLSGQDGVGVWGEEVRGATRAASWKGAQRSKDPLDELVTQQHLGGGPPLLLHEHLAQEVSAGIGRALGQQRPRWLRGDLKDGRHGFVLRPGGLLGQHLHHGAGHAPGDTHDIIPTNINMKLGIHMKLKLLCSGKKAGCLDYEWITLLITQLHIEHRHLEKYKWLLIECVESTDKTATYHTSALRPYPSPLITSGLIQ